MLKDKICVYDGVTLLIHDPVSIEHIRSNPKRYNLKGTHCMLSGEPTGIFSGKFKNLDIKTGGNSRGMGVKLCGSIHKWKNTSHNHDSFYWHQLLEVYEELKAEFKFDPHQVDVCSIEAGVNIPFDLSWEYEARQIARNTILFKGEPKSSIREKLSNGGYQLKLKKGESAIKIYDKGRQFKLSHELLRYEKCFQKFRASKIRRFSDLLDHDKHNWITQDLLKTFETLILWQPEILEQKDLPNEVRMFLKEHQCENTWLEYRTEKKYLQFNKALIKYDDLLNKYCRTNYKAEILSKMKLLLC